MLNKYHKALIDKAITYLKANYDTENRPHLIDSDIACFGLQCITKRSFTVVKDQSPHKNFNLILTLHDMSIRSRKHEAKIKRYHFYALATNLYTSYYHMQNVKRQAVSNDVRWLLYMATLGRMLNKAHTIRLYTVLFTLKDSRLLNDKGKLLWTDKTNGKDSYKSLATITNKLSHQLSNNKTLSSVHKLSVSYECPYHLKTKDYSNARIKDVYGHPHTHMLLAVTDPRQLDKLRSDISTDVKKVCGYQPLTFHIKPLLTDDSKPAVIRIGGNNKASVMAVAKTVRYFLKDYHLQTKDCPSISVFKQLPPKLQHLIVHCQLNSTKGKHLHQNISKRTLERLNDEIKALKRYKSVNIGQSVPLFSRKDVPEAKSINGRIFTRHHISENEALHRIYWHGYYFTEDEHLACPQVTISLFKEGRSPRIKAGIGTTTERLKLPKDDLSNSFEIKKNKKYLNHYLDTS